MANSKFVIDTGIVCGPLTIFASNGDIRTSGNIVYTQSGTDNQITTTGTGSGFTSSTTLYFPGVQGGSTDYATTTTTVDGVATTVDETVLGLGTLVPSLDAFGAIIAESTNGASDIYDCMEPAGFIETVDLGAFS
jgi:hypothetical protein